MTDTLTTPVPATTVQLFTSELRAGDHLDQTEFHARYLRTPAGFTAELVEGVVIVPSPLGLAHSDYHADVLGWLKDYELATPGVKALIGPTLILGPSAEPQPDALLIIEPERGGKTRIERPEGEKEDYVAGPPELVVEVASSRVAYDLHSKKRDYEKSGVTEYLVVLVREASVRWFRREQNRFIDLAPAEDGTLRSQVFPGLWLDAAALVARDYAALIGTLQRGLASPEHAAFVELLESRASRD